MKIIVGLGNPGAHYQTTRHNIGWMVLDAIAASFNQTAFSRSTKFYADFVKVGDVYLLKPLTYMNESGLAIRSFLQYYFAGEWQDMLSSLYVIHDDLDISLGEYKIQFGKGPKVHHGLQSIHDHLKTDQFWHIRVGIDNRQGDRSILGKDYVLQPFMGKELNQVKEVIDQVVIKMTYN